MQEVLFHFGGRTAVLRFLVHLRKPRQYKKFVEKKRKFRRTFGSMQNCVELQCLVDVLVSFLELSMFTNASFTCTI